MFAIAVHAKPWSRDPARNRNTCLAAVRCAKHGLWTKRLNFDTACEISSFVDIDDFVSSMPSIVYSDDVPSFVPSDCYSNPVIVDNCSSGYQVEF